jgi:hypothetical protein
VVLAMLAGFFQDVASRELASIDAFAIYAGGQA